MNVISAGNYSDLKDIVSTLPFKPIAVFTNGQGSPPDEFQIMVVFHEWKIAVICHGTQNPSPPPGFSKPPTFDTDFPGAVVLGSIPTFS